MSRPKWLGEPLSIRARLTACPRCKSAVIRALDSPIAAIDVRLDPIPLDEIAELRARLEGRRIYDLIRIGDHQEIADRNQWRMKHREHPVLATHKCPGPIPHTQIPAPRRKRKAVTNDRPPF